jgi:predicted Zn-dependent peptidase
MFKKYTLKNGLRIIVAPMHETKAMTALVLVKVGSRYETRKINGVSHFVEHLLFKGTKKRPTSLDISKELDGIGAEFNAFTSKDHTGYYIKANYEKAELALEMLSDMLFNSLFDTSEIERERGVIVEEINMYEDNPLMFAEVLFEQTMYGDHPLGWHIAGPKEVIKSVTREDIMKYHHYYYQPKNMLVAVAGRQDAKLLNLIKKYFGQARNKQTIKKFPSIVIKQKVPQLSLKFKDTEQVQLCLGFPSYDYFDKKLYTLYLLGVILGGNMSSRLFTSIRDKKGLCYFIRAGVNVYQDTGNLMIQAGLDKSRLKEAVVEILKELKKIKRGDVTTSELRKAKDFLRGKLILDLETSDHVASWFSKQELLTDKMLTPAKQLELLEKVKLAEIKKVANELVVTKKINLSLIGPFKKKSELHGLLNL